MNGAIELWQRTYPQIHCGFHFVCFPLIYFAARKNSKNTLTLWICGGYKLHGIYSNHWWCGLAYGAFVSVNAKRPTRDICAKNATKHYYYVGTIHVRSWSVNYLIWLAGKKREWERERKPQPICLLNITFNNSVGGVRRVLCRGHRAKCMKFTFHAGISIA